MEQLSLFGDLSRPDKQADIELTKKSKTKQKKAPTVRGGSISSKINKVREFVEKHLGKYKDQYITITTEMQLEFYVKACIKAKCVSIDTETTGLDPMLDKIVGVCLYYPGGNGAYIPLRHKSYITGELLPNQLSPEVVAKYLVMLVDIEEDEMFNAKFDTRFIKNDLGVKLHCTWDGYLAARCMNENEEHTNLKYLHSKYVLDGKEDEFSFGEIFKGISIDLIPIDIATLYGAHDAVITHELRKFQAQYLYYDPACTFDDRNGMNGVAWCFFNIEMPLIEVLCELEDTGILLDKEYAHKLSVEYSEKKEQALQTFYDLTANLVYPKGVDVSKLDNPINIGSPQQLAILFYDILGYEVVDDKSPRGTGVDILQKWDTELTRAILEYRAIDKLLGTYIDKLPECVNPNDGRVHCSFNQYGADTGRMSSSDPNLQNIPSHNKDIRKMFVASPGYVLMSSDYSQQEPSCLASFCHKMGYDKLYNVRLGGGDLYSAVASACYKLTYEECLEHNPDGTTNKEGKVIRNKAKPVLLGILYSRGDKSVAEGMGIPFEKAKQLKANLFKKYPEIMIFERKSLEMGEDLGYVTTICGRKRRLPDLQLDEYEFKWVDAPKSDDVLDFDGEVNDEVPDEICNKYWRKLRQARFGQKRKIFEEANKKDGVWIIDNGGKIADATRQCVNARIQGSAADLTKLAMIDLYHNEELRKLGFRMLVPVHDEIIAECPEENAKECSRLLAEVMSKAAEKILNMPFKCDVALSYEWYGEELNIT
jgi:DNA polymerase I-like protein with 3'-5' exonuclease and polymerase domains